MWQRLRQFNIFSFLSLRLGLDGVALYYELCYWWIGRRRATNVDSQTILNFGYAPVSSTVTTDPHAREPFQLELYHQVANAVGRQRLREGRVVEISCGMGGGFEHLVRHFEIETGVVVDRSLSALRVARRRFGLTAIRADAHKLPFAPGSLDVVINVEASHIYSFSHFLSQAARVLAPEGLLCIADYRGAAFGDVEAELRRALTETGFEVGLFRDVTENIVEALRLNTPRVEAYLARVPWPVRGSFRQWGALENTPTYNRLKARDSSYFILVARRTGVKVE